jgi:hypothetical protein
MVLACTVAWFAHGVQFCVAWLCVCVGVHVRVQVYTTVSLPSGLGQQRLAGSGKGQAGQLMAEILKQQGHARTDMRKILDQLPHFLGCDASAVHPCSMQPTTTACTNRAALHAHAESRFHAPQERDDPWFCAENTFQLGADVDLVFACACRQDDALVQGLADRMRLFSFPPASLIYARGTVCNEMLVLLSGQVRAGSRQSKRAPSHTYVRYTDMVRHTHTHHDHRNAHLRLLRVRTSQ